MILTGIWSVGVINPCIWNGYLSQRQSLKADFTQEISGNSNWEMCWKINCSHCTMPIGHRFNKRIQCIVVVTPHNIFVPLALFSYVYIGLNPQGTRLIWIYAHRISLNDLSQHYMDIPQCFVSVKLPLNVLSVWFSPQHWRMTSLPLYDLRLTSDDQRSKERKGRKQRKNISQN